MDMCFELIKVRFSDQYHQSLGDIKSLGLYCVNGIIFCEDKIGLLSRIVRAVQRKGLSKPFARTRVSMDPIWQLVTRLDPLHRGIEALIEL